MCTLRRSLDPSDVEKINAQIHNTFELFRFSQFTLTEIDNLVFIAEAKGEKRLIVCAFTQAESFENDFAKALLDLEKQQQPCYFNRMIFSSQDPLEATAVQKMIWRYQTKMRSLHIEKVLVRYANEVIEIKNILCRELNISKSAADPSKQVSKATVAELRELQILNKGGVWAYRIPLLIESLAHEFRKQRPSTIQENFVELDLDHSQTVIHPTTGSIDCNFGELIPVERQFGHNEAGVVIGIKTDDLGIGIPIKRILIIGDLSHSSRGAIRNQECIRINAAIRLAAREKLPIDWYTASYGVQIHRERGVEGLDAAASTIREIVVNCHHKGVQINFIIDEANIGAQSYWDSMGAIVYSTSGIIIMTPNGCMALTGPKALAAALYSTVSSEQIGKYSDALYPNGLQSLSGHELVHGPNSDSMIFAKDLEQASRYLLLHHYYAYLKPEEKIASKRISLYDGALSPSDQEALQKEMDNFLKGLKPDRRRLLDYLRDSNSPAPLEFWGDSRGIRKQTPKNGDLPQEASTIVQEMLIGGHPTLVIFTPTGPLTPADADIIARAIYKASGHLQVLIIGSLSGFSCDPLSMENRQLREGAHIAKAIVEHQGPILICNLGSLVGGTFVVFNKQLNKDLRILAIEGSRVQVIGGKSAAKVVFHSSICKKADQDDRIRDLSKSILERTESPTEARTRIISEIEDKEGVLFDQFHNARRALKVKSIDEIVTFNTLKEAIIKNFDELRVYFEKTA